MLKIIPKKKDDSKKLMLKDVKENQLFRFVGCSVFYLKTRTDDSINKNDLFVFFDSISNTVGVCIFPNPSSFPEVEILNYSLTLEYEEKEKKN